MTDDTPSSQPEASDHVARFDEALGFIKDGRWTEAKRALWDVAAVDPEYKNVGKLQAMVDEVLEVSRFGFQVPPHIAAQQRVQYQQYEDEEEEEDDEPYIPLPRQKGWSAVQKALVFGGFMVVCVAIWFLFGRA
jgi:hypothetical protein